MMINKQAIMALFIAGIMILSTFGFILSERVSSGQNYNYNGVKFTLSEEGLFTIIKGQKIFFQFLPNSLETLSIDENSKKILKETSVITISYDQESEDAEALGYAQYLIEDRALKTEKPIIQRALTKKNIYSLPEINCNNATQTSPVITFKKANQTKIEEKNSCIIINYETQQEILEASDKITYFMNGIMN